MVVNGTAARRLRWRHHRALAVALAVWMGSMSAAMAPPRALRGGGGGSLVSVIVAATENTVGQVAQSVEAVGGSTVRTLHSLGYVIARVPAASVEALLHSPFVRGVSPDARVHLSGTTYNPVTDTGSMDNTTLMTGAQAAWAQGYTGRGVDVALIDSGVVPVNGLQGTSKVVFGPDLSLDPANSPYTNYDTFGHGTHMAGIIAGRASTAVYPYTNQPDTFDGMAPDARLVSIKVADATGDTDVSQVLAGIDWAVQYRHSGGLDIRVINLSFGTDSIQPYAIDPLAFATEVAWRNGIVVVTSTGNTGFKLTGVDDPGYDPYVVAVGAADTHGTDSYADDTVASFSSTGDGARDPDLVAPGVHIVSLRDPGSYIDQTYGSTGLVAHRYFRGSGTSQATAVVSGAAALLLQQRPGLTPDQVKKLLTSTATPLAGQLPTAQGAGELNVAAALAAPTPSVITSSQPWVPSTGLGSIEASRGSVHLTQNGLVVTGEVDVFGNTLNAGTLAVQEAGLTSWTGTWDGVTWTGNTWTGNTWTGNTWTGNTWTGNTWTGNTWTGNTWTGNTWTGNTWTGNTWTTSDWS